ncbi:hypothetical protein Oweho_1862 [Owenweeksia hongkongensis DSM 17368]|uniref:Uncharacterized protein n=1 Tax=Owenweeksia hongkongensis (strain DSM 17368 / CIP 108786 / JCM 12287 / NRRL B-23963 / UST20020801) TaxID=926562 RepID=G8R1R5_OWEHD|nr:hypothetical protein [Owenweeksia hongkongensis]AEV32841.1 hypothetical protein Oweho_1862 [Owenweeksia hongkongensis DSM 17368]
MKNLIRFILLVIIISACTKDNDSRVRFKLRSNSPVQFGSSLRVFVTSENDDDRQYVISHPANREYDGSYETDSSRGSDNGWYFTSTYDGDGNLITDSTHVTIVPAAVPCKHPVDTLTSAFSNDDLYFYSVNGGMKGTGSYKIDAYGQHSELTMDFGQKSVPTESRTYISKESSVNNTVDEVSILLRWNVISFTGVPNQLAHLEMDSTRSTLTLCDFEMTSGTTKILVNTTLEL